MTRPTLQELAYTHTCERAWTHSYLPDYEEVLGHLRDEPVVLLEIGIGYNLFPRGPHDEYLELPPGAGLRMWREYFSRGLILGADNQDCHLPNEDRIVILPRCNQADPVLAEYVRMHAPDGLDIVIDDGSHREEDQHASYRLLRPLLKPGAFYFVEDIQEDEQIGRWLDEPGYAKHWARHQQGPGGKFRADDILVMLRG